MRNHEWTRIDWSNEHEYSDMVLAGVENGVMEILSLIKLYPFLYQFDLIFSVKGNG